MKLLISVLLILMINLAFPQAQSVNFNSIDSKEIETASPATLAKLLIINDTTDRQKVRSIFKWVTDNIAYNVKSFQNRGRASSADYWLEADDDTSVVLKPLNERVAEMVLKRRTAVCDGYSRLFKTLCDYAGIRCETITGYAKTNMNRIGVQFRSNHKWNAVFIDSNWCLLDATWASGYINYRDEFEREYNAHYFLTPPDEFILDHYPEDLRWTLLSYPPTFKEFNYTPFKTAAFSRNYTSAFKPENGIIEASVGDSIVIELETNRPKRNIWVIDVTNADSNTIWIMQCCGVGKPVNIIKGNKVSYTYRVVSDRVEWLNIIYDDEMIMRYKLNIKKDIQGESIMKV